MIEQLQLPLAVLSYGRAASVLIAHNIGKKINALPTYVHNLSSIGQINHCHLTEIYPWKQRVFAVRYPMDAVLSFALTQVTDTYHITVDDTASFKPQYIDVKQKRCYLLAEHCSKWYNFYTSTLTQDDLVVNYEQLNLQINQDSQRYRPTFPDKKKLIINYDDVVNFFRPNLELVLPLYQKFVNHKNRFDIYQIIAN